MSEVQEQSREATGGDRKLRLLAIISYVLLVVSSVRYNFGRRSPWDNGHVDDVAFTPFTAQTELVVIYWLFTFFWQLVYLTNAFDDTPRIFNLVFIATNLLELIWSYLFARSHYFLSEVVTILTFNLLLATYLFGYSYAFKSVYSWLVVHGSVVVLPLVWTHHVIWWNGAVLFSARGWLSRIVANVFIWEYLVVFGLLLLITGDYLLGLASSYLLLALAIGQLFTKVFALQWIFAFVIAGSLFALSGFVALFIPRVTIVEENFRGPVIHTFSDENQPLLGP